MVKLSIHNEDVNKFLEALKASGTASKKPTLPVILDGQRREATLFTSDPLMLKVEISGNSILFRLEKSSSGWKTYHTDLPVPPAVFPEHSAEHAQKIQELARKSAAELAPSQHAAILRAILEYFRSQG
ncbi:MAG TPA: hypothetical protein VD907_02370 [Verrucomicrobiae bacterium]|nr:hypothetical protein [Verrucomicrobiae bacterium]